MYLYACRSDSFRWGHISSTDLIHWRSHPDAVIPDDLDGGIFSGGAFVDDDETCYLTYWGLPISGNQGGIRIIKSNDRHYEKWEKFKEYMLECTTSGVHQTTDENGKTTYLGCADPSNIWKKDGKYYMQTGNLSVLFKFHQDGLTNYPKNDEIKLNTPENLKGDWVDLFESDDLKNWKYLHRFYQRNKANKWTEIDEDDMCPSFLPLPLNKNGGELSDKYLQLFISHNRGCQYYIGTYDKENNIFIPESHGRMSWIDNTFFAPEALTDKNNRQIMWAWLTDNRTDEINYGWSGVYGLPRCLWLREDNKLGIAPVDEIKMLRYNKKEFKKINRRQELEGINGLCCEITAEYKIDSAQTKSPSIYLRANDNLSEFTKIYYDYLEKVLVFDSLKSGKEGRLVIEKAPLDLNDKEILKLDIFIDKSVIEVFANERQAICRRVYPCEQSDKVVFEKGFDNVIVYEMMPSNLY